eukprot:755797-Hanusia_phi.AAC.4
MSSLLRRLRCDRVRSSVSRETPTVKAPITYVEMRESKIQIQVTGSGVSSLDVAPGVGAKGFDGPDAAPSQSQEALRGDILRRPQDSGAGQGKLGTGAERGGDSPPAHGQA